MKRIWIGGPVVAALVIGLTLAASAADPTRKQCFLDARQERKTCTQVCNDTFLASIDSCRGVDHDCADTARDTRQQCVTDVLTELSQCVSTNCAIFVQGIADCRAAHPAGTPERDACVDGQQLLLFQCRDTCRESVHVFAGLKTCRDEFRADLKECKPPTPPPGPSTIMGPG